MLQPVQSQFRRSQLGPTFHDIPAAVVVGEIATLIPEQGPQFLYMSKSFHTNLTTQQKEVLKIMYTESKNRQLNRNDGVLSQDNGGSGCDYISCMVAVMIGAPTFFLLAMLG